MAHQGLLIFESGSLDAVASSNRWKLKTFFGKSLLIPKPVRWFGRMRLIFALMFYTVLPPEPRFLG